MYQIILKRVSDMKNLLFGLFAVILLVSCQPNQDFVMPEDMEGLKVVQRETKTEISNQEARLAEIEGKMAALDPTMFEKPKKLVTGISLSSGDFERFIELQGSVQADETVHVSSEAGGRIVNLTVKDGDYIGRGKLIARIDLDALDKQIAEVEKSMELAKQIYERQDRLWKQNIGTEIQFLQAKNNVERLEKNIETLNYQKTKANVYSPISGEVAMVNKEMGEVVGPGESIATLLNTNKLKIAVDIPENLLPAVNRGDYVTVRIPALDYEKKHRVKRIGTQINPANRTIPVEVEIYNKGGKIKPNLLATMLIKDFESKDVVTIPTTLLQQEVSGKYFVFAIGEAEGQKVVVKKYVKSAESYEDRIVISEGLSADDVIVDKGSRQIANGDHLNVESIMTMDENRTESK